MSKAKELEQRLERTEQQLRLFQKISRFMVRDMSLPDVLKGVVSLIVEFTQCDSCLVYLEDGGELVLCASNTPHTGTIGKVRMKTDEGLTGWVARERRLVAISREAYKDARFKGFRRSAGRHFRGVSFRADHRAQSRGGRHQRAASPAAPAHRRRNGSAHYGRRADRLRADARAHGLGRARFGEPRGIGALRPLAAIPTIMELKLVALEIPENGNIVLGQSHFIKTAEDIYEAIVNTVPQMKFGVAFNEASGPCLTRVEGNDEALKALAARNASAARGGPCLRGRDARRLSHQRTGPHQRRAGSLLHLLRHRESRYR